jgi:hypothetical protein
VNRTAPKAIRDALRNQSWQKSSFDVRALIGKTQVVWVYDATCKLSGETVALKCYRKELQSAINYQCAPCPSAQHPHQKNAFVSFQDMHATISHGHENSKHHIVSEPL